MASSDLIDFFKTWTQADVTERTKQVKYVEKGIDRIMERKSPLWSKLRKGENKYTPEVTWMEQLDYERKLTGTLETATDTITISGNIWNASATAANLARHVWAADTAANGGTILQRDSDGMQCRVTNVSDLVLSVSAWGNSTLTSDSGVPTTYTILNYLSSDYDDTWNPMGVDRNLRKCGTQVIKYSLEIPDTRRDMRMEQVADEIKYQLKMIFDKAVRDIAQSGINIQPYYSSGWKYGLETATPAVTSICAWKLITEAEFSNPNTYVDKSSVALDVDDLNSLVYHNYYDEKADYNTGKWCIACAPVTHQYIADEFLDHREFSMKETEIGYQVETFRSKMGKAFPLIADEYVRPDVLLLCNVSDLEWGWYGKQRIKVNTLPETMENVTKKKITGQFWGVKARKPRQIGMLYGLPTTYT